VIDLRKNGIRYAARVSDLDVLNRVKQKHPGAAGAWSLDAEQIQPIDILYPECWSRVGFLAGNLNIR
jgi:hypothetical protein